MAKLSRGGLGEKVACMTESIIRVASILLLRAGAFPSTLLLTVTISVGEPVGES